MFFKKKIKIVFSKTVWKNNREKRSLMVDDLIQQKILLNKTREEVLDILGFEFNDANSNIWTYYIAVKRFFFSSKKYLSVFFDKEGLVHKTTYQ